MSFQIERGLFRPDFVDHHAILGVPVDMEIKEIRKRYLKVARRLHPDSFSSDNEADRAQASQLLSKLVNPAWEKLSQEREWNDYQIVLKLKGQQASTESLELGSEVPKQLLNANDIDGTYRRLLKELAEHQYNQIDQALEITAQISELNLVYLIRKDGVSGGESKRSSPYATGGTTGTTPTGGRPAPSQNNPVMPPPRPESVTEQFFRRAQDCFSRGNYAQATLELRDALKIEPNNSRLHSLMGMVYLKQNQGTMAKIHFNKAIASDPEDEIANAGLRQLGINPTAGAVPPTDSKDAKSKGDKSKGDKSKGDKSKGDKSKGDKSKGNKSKGNDNKSGGGLFGLFGKKK